MKRSVSVIHEGETTEIQWGDREPVDGALQGYVQIHGDGALTVPFRTDNDDPIVFVLDGGGARLVLTEDQPPDHDATVLWDGTAPFSIDPELLRLTALKEWGIAKLMGADDAASAAWYEYVGALVKLTDDYLAAGSS